MPSDQEKPDVFAVHGPSWEKPVVSFGFLAVFCGLLAAHLYLLRSTSIYPFIDLPDHLATAAILRYYDDPSGPYGDYYQIGSFWFRPNLLHILLCSAKLFPSVEWVNRLYYCLYAVLLPGSVLLIVLRLGGNPWVSLLSFTLLYNFNVSWGFSGYTLSIPLCLLALVAQESYLKRMSICRGALLAGFLVLIFLTHALATAFALSCFVLVSFNHHRALNRRLLASLVPAIPVMVLIAVWWSSREVSALGGPGVVGSLTAYYRTEFLGTLPHRLRLPVLDNYFLFPGWHGAVVACLFSVAATLPLAYAAFREIRFKSAMDAPPERTSGSAGIRGIFRSDASPYAVMFCWAFVCFAVLPGEIFNFQILYPRFSVTFFLGAIILGSFLPGPGRTGTSGLRKWPKVLAVVAACLHLCLWADYFRSFDAENRGFDRSFFPHDAKTKTLAGIVYDLSFRGKPIYFHFPSYYPVWTHGVGTSRIVDFVDFAPPISRKPGGKFVPVYKEWAWSSPSFEPSYLKVDYLLVRGTVPGLGDNVPPQFRFMRSAGAWKLYENREVPERGREP